MNNQKTTIIQVFKRFKYLLILLVLSWIGYVTLDKIIERRPQTLQKNLNEILDQTALEVREFQAKSGNHTFFDLTGSKDLTGNIYCIYKGEDLKFWTSNQLNIKFINKERRNFDRWEMRQLSNVQVLERWYPLKNQEDLLVIIPVNYTYSIENNWIHSSIHSKLDPNANFILNDPGDEEGFSITASPGGKTLFRIRTVKLTDSLQKDTYLGSLIVLAFLIWVLLHFYQESKSGRFKGVLPATILFAYALTLSYLIAKFTDIQLNINSVDRITGYNLSIMLLFFLLGDLIYKNLTFLHQNLKGPLPKALILLVYFLSLQLSGLYMQSREKDQNMTDMAGNMIENGFLDNDPVQRLMLENLDEELLRLGKDSSSFMNGYRVAKDIENLSRKISGKYDFRMHIDSIRDKEHRIFREYIQETGKKVSNTHFYLLPENKFSMSFTGVYNFPNQDSLFCILEISPKKNVKSFSFPNILVPDKYLKKDQDLSWAIFQNGQSDYSHGNFPYHIYTEAQKAKKRSFEGHLFITISNPEGEMVVMERPLQKMTSQNLLFWTYMYLILLVVSWIIQKLDDWRMQKVFKYPGLVTRVQIIFIGLLLISFVGIFIFSVQYIRNKYEAEQILDLNKKKSYIQQALQELYYWTEDISLTDNDNLNKELQNLAYIYQTDIHVYDNQGKLKGSSQNMLFERNILSQVLDPKICFAPDAQRDKQEQVGNLQYLAGYIDLVNGDFLQIGYISIPQYLSMENIRTEINAFLGTIVHIYFIILILSFLIIFWVGNQMSVPLQMIERKLAEIKLGNRNARIDYKGNDEIGQLVAQYNKTIDELEKSAGLLAQSERESAWRTMARQIAHEINNPLTPMKLTIQQLQRSKDMDQDHFNKYFEKSTQTLIDEINHLSNIAGSFSQFARLPESRMARIDAASRLRTICGLFNNDEERVDIVCDANEEIWVWADPDQLGQVFTNLIKNAVQAIPSERKGLVEAMIRQGEKDVEIHIMDNGKGIDPENREKLFVPNFTTKSTGMGLGLAIVKNIVELSGGTIDFTSSPDSGTDFEIHLPFPKTDKS